MSKYPSVQIIWDKLIWKCYGHHHALVNHYEIYVLQMTKDSSVCHNHKPVLFSFKTHYRVCTKSNTTDATCGTGTDHPSGVPDFTLGFMWGSCCSIFSFLYSILYNIVCQFSFCQCIDCSSSSSNYGFRLHLLYLHPFFQLLWTIS
jgi:hypothetical protein